MLDYYLVGSDGVLVEEFVLDESCHPLGLDSAYWTPAHVGQLGWRDGSELSLAMRADAGTRTAVRPVGRAEAASRCGLADETTLREYFTTRLAMSAAPLSLGIEQVCRILLAGQSEPTLPPGSAGSVRWELRNVGPGVAWAVDVYGPACPELVHQLKDLMRQQGQLPIAIERLG